MSIIQRLEDYWLSLRLAKIDISGFHLLRDRPPLTSSTSSQTFNEALALYLRLKEVGKGKVLHQGGTMYVQTCRGEVLTSSH